MNDNNQTEKDTKTGWTGTYAALLFLLIYGAIALLLTSSLVMFEGPMLLALVLLGPIFIAALLFPRWNYLSMIAIAGGVNYWMYLAMRPDALADNTVSLSIIGLSVGSMAEIILQMARRLKNTTKQLESINATLEERVQNRTHRLQEAKQSLEAEIEERKLTEIKLIKAREQAEEMARAKSVFLANMSHEIRTPLTSVLGYASVLEKRVAEEHRRYAQVIHRNGERLLETLNSVLDLARLESTDDNLDLSRLDIVTESKEGVRLLMPLAEKKKLTLSVKTNYKSLYVNLNWAAFGRIFNNLVGNAIKFTETGDIVVRIDQNADSVMFCVEDTGVGIDPTFLTQIFQPFQQESAGMARSHEGSGLGLAITRRLVTLMNGTIEVKARAGGGTMFLVKFPTVNENKSPANHRPDVFLQPNPKDLPDTILVLDDNVETCSLVYEMIGDLTNVVTSNTAVDALNKASESFFPIIVLDIHLGKGKSGLEVLYELRAMDQYKETPIIAATAYALPGDKEKFLSAGFTGYISKPFSRAQLISSLMLPVMAADQV